MSGNDFSDLSALFLNCSINPDASASHTMRLLERAARVMRAEGVDVSVEHVLDHDIAFGMQQDMTEHGASVDEWPALQARVEAADILVLGSPIWLGQSRASPPL